MEYVRQVAARYNFRVPDVNRMWSGKEDSTDSSDRNQERSLALKFEFLFVRLQELALWTDLQASLAAIGALHLLSLYLYLTQNTGVNLLAWLGICGFVYTTWTNRIWPEIRVEPTEEELERENAPFVPVNPIVYSGPEVEAFIQKCCQCGSESLSRLSALRRRSPGKFCALACLSLALVAYVGSFLTALSLFYLSCLALLTIPGLIRAGSENPAVVEKYNEAREALSPFLDWLGLGMGSDEPDCPPNPEVSEETCSTSILATLKDRVREVFEESPEEDLTPVQTEEVMKILDKADPASSKASKVVDGEMEIRQRMVAYMEEAEKVQPQQTSAVPVHLDALSGGPEITNILGEAAIPSKVADSSSSDEEGEDSIESPFAEGMKMPDAVAEDEATEGAVLENQEEDDDFLPNQNISTSLDVGPSKTGTESPSPESLKMRAPALSSHPVSGMPDPDSSTSSDEEDEIPESGPNPKCLQANPAPTRDSAANPESGLSEKQTVMLTAAMREDSKSSGDSSPERKSSGKSAQGVNQDSDNEDFELITEDELHKADEELLNLN